VQDDFYMWLDIMFGNVAANSFDINKDLCLHYSNCSYGRKGPFGPQENKLEWKLALAWSSRSITSIGLSNLDDNAPIPSPF
jgi:hypothetical protein